MFANLDLQQLLVGRFTIEQIPYHEPILQATFAGVAVVGLTVLGVITYYRFWGPMWRDWITSIDHKKIGIMYCIFALIMLLRGFADALMMRTQQAIAFGDQQGFLPPHHYDQIFTAHGMIMIFFVAMPFVTGLMNFAVPLQIGARDVAFPFLNNFSFWMTVSGGMLVMVSLFVGEFSRATWLAYPPLSGAAMSPGVGVDYYIWALQIAGIGTTLSGINLIATIVKMRAPGLSMMKLPIFVWSSLCTNILIVAAFLPHPYGLAAPASLKHFVLFLITLVLGLLMTVSLCMLVYILAFFTISPAGLRLIFDSASDFFAGALIPLPFFPEKMQRIMELLPFASMQNVPLRIYGGSMSSYEMKRAVFLQVFWLIAITFAGNALCRLAQKRVTVQGG